MEFLHEIQIDEKNVSISLDPEIEKHLDNHQLRASVTGEFDELDAIQINNNGNLILTPSFIECNTKIKLISPNPEEKIQLEINKYSEKNASATIEFPSFSVMNAARICFYDNINKLPPQLTRLYEGKEAEKLAAFVDELSATVRYHVYIDIVEQLADISPKFRHFLRQNIEKQLVDMLTGHWQDEEYSIKSYSDIQSRINDFKNLGPIRKLSKEIVAKEIIEDALIETAQSGSIYDVVALARTLSLYNHHAELLSQHQTDAILAQQLLKDDYTEAWELILNCLDTNGDYHEDYYEIKEKAISADDNETKRKLWKASLTNASGNKNLRISIANYLYWSVRVENYSIETNILLYRAASRGFDKGNVSHMYQYSKFNQNFQKGIMLSNESNYKKAANSFLQAYETGYPDNDQFEHSIPGWINALKNWALKLSEDYRFNGNYEEGIRTIESAVEDLTESNEDDKNKIKEDSVTELRAQKRILEMEQYLVNGNYELALETAGNIIRLYSETDNGNQDWAIIKRKEIKAIIDETNGDLDEASSLHQDISESESISEPRQNWHTHRADICKAKSLALNNKYKEAKQRLLKIQERTDRLKNEANDLAVVLEAINNYEENIQRDFQDSLNKLSDNPTNEPRTPPMRLEYNYEDPLSVIHSAQWLQTYDVDPEVLLMSVEVALRASLIPLHGGEGAAKDVGLDDVNVRQQWLMELPAPIAQRITQIRLDTSVPQTDYSGLGSRLYTLLEIYLAIFGEYYGKLKWGDEWRRNLSDQNKTSDMALGDLTNIFNKCENKIKNNEEVATLINGTNSQPPVEKLRNDIGHGKTDDVHSKEYEKFQDRVFSIFEKSLEDVPVIGKMIETRGEGDFQVELFQLSWWQTQRRMFIQTDAELQEDTFYYLPHQPITQSADNSKINIDANRIYEVETDRITEKL